MRARLAIRKNGSSVGGLGLFRKNSHDLVEIPDCLAHHPSINRAAALVQQELNRLQLEPYDEVRQTGSLRYAQFFVCREAGLVQLSLISRDQKSARLLAEELWKTPSLWHSIWVNLHTAKSNAILGTEWIHLYGELFLRQRVGASQVAFHPASFSQAHLSLFDQLLCKIESWVRPQARLLEVYAGAGAISLHLYRAQDGFSNLESARQSKIAPTERDHCTPCVAGERGQFCKVAASPNSQSLTERGMAPLLSSAILVEDNPYSHSSFLSSNPPESFHYHLGDAKEAIKFLGDADVVLVDPPRKGLDPMLLQALKAERDKELIYISCSFDSFERDALQLLASGWKLKDAAGYWLFPGADHIELATFWVKSADL